MKVTDCIECPNCHKPFLKQTESNSVWYCHKCHTEFSTNELVHQWGLDAGDLFGYYTNYKFWAPEVNSTLQFHIQKGRKEVYGSVSTHYSEFVGGEPYWSTGQERNSAYQMVSRMLLDIPEFDDYADMLNTYADGLDVGVQ